MKTITSDIIKLTLGEQEIEMTINEALELKEELDKLFPSYVKDIVQPPPIDFTKYFSPAPILCNNTTTDDNFENY